MRRFPVIIAVVAICLVALFMAYRVWNQYRVRRIVREWQCTDEPYTSFTNRLARILVGAATSEVVRLAGRPNTQFSTNDVEVWVYRWDTMNDNFWRFEGSGTVYRVTVSNGAVAKKELNENVLWAIVGLDTQPWRPW